MTVHHWTPDILDARSSMRCAGSWRFAANYVRLARPQGFRDTDGLSVRGGSLRAKVFASPAGATVVYFAPEPFEGELVPKTARLGMHSPGTVRQSVSVPANQMDT